MFYLSLSGVLGIGEDIYMTRGFNNEGRSSKEVFVYNTRSRQRRPLHQMNEDRYGHVMVMLEKIYVIGGWKREGKESKEGEDSEKETFI